MEHAHDALVVDLERRRIRAEIDLVQNDGLRSDLQACAVRGELPVDRLEAFRCVVLRRVDHVQEEVRALEVRKKLVTEPDAFTRSLDQPGDVGHRQLARTVRRVHRAEHGRQRRERVLRHLRFRVGDARQQRRLAGVRQADERRVGEQLEPQLQLRLFTEQACLGETRRPPRRRRETLVAASGDAAARRDDARSRCRKVGDQLLVLVEHLRPDRHAKLDRLAGRPVLQRTASGLAATGLEATLGPKARRGREGRGRR